MGDFTIAAPTEIPENEEKNDAPSHPTNDCTDWCSLVENLNR